MTTEAKVSDVPAIIEHDANERTKQVAEAAAAQIDQANKDAEAIARAAQQTDLGGRIQSMHEENQSWRATLEQRISEQKAEAETRAAELKALILANTLTPPLTPPAPVVVEPEPASVSDEPKPNSKLTDTTAETTPKRRRVLL